MITVHHLNQSRSTRIIWLLEELAVPYEITHHQRDEQTHLAPQSLQAIHPLAKAPVIVDGNVVLAESGAIIEYILNKYPNNSLRPKPDSDQFNQYIEWLHFAEGSLALPVITSLILGMESRDGTKPIDGYITKELNLDLSYIEQTLAQQKYFAGHTFSAADIMMTIVLEMANKLELLNGRDKIKAYLDTINQRNAYKTALSYG